jgi:hypothetical protein
LIYGPGRSLSASKHNAVSSVTTAVPSYVFITPHHIVLNQDGRSSVSALILRRAIGFGRYETDFFGSGFAFGDGHLLGRPLNFRYFEQ